MLPGTSIRELTITSLIQLVCLPVFHSHACYRTKAPSHPAILYRLCVCMCKTKMKAKKVNQSLSWGKNSCGILPPDILQTNGEWKKKTFCKKHKRTIKLSHFPEEKILVRCTVGWGLESTCSKRNIKFCKNARTMI